MYFKQSVVLLLATTLLQTIKAGSLPGDNANFNFLSLMVRSNDLMQRNPSRSSDCFNYYIPLIDQIAKSYQQSHDTCLQAARDGRSEAEAATQDQRNALAASASSSCELLSKCSELSSAEKVFECYVAGGAENTKTMYAINVNAAENLSDLQEEFRLVENREYKCTNETKRQYERDSSKAYEDFNKCILGIIDVPATTEAPVEPETTTEEAEVPNSTANPEETTQPPLQPETTSEDPESTINPEESTQAPAETETTEAPEDGSGEANLESKLPEEDLSLRRYLV